MNVGVNTVSEVLHDDINEDDQINSDDGPSRNGYSVHFPVSESIPTEDQVDELWEIVDNFNGGSLQDRNACTITQAQFSIREDGLFLVVDFLQRRNDEEDIVNESLPLLEFLRNQIVLFVNQLHFTRAPESERSIQIEIECFEDDDVDSLFAIIDGASENDNESDEN